MKAIIMPKFGMDQEEGTVAQWLKQAGDAVQKGEAILEVETDKVNMEVEATASGRLAGISAQPGDTVPIGETIGWILAEGESLEQGSRVAGGRGKEEVTAPANGQSAPAPLHSSAPAQKASPVARRMASEHGIDLKAIDTNGRITKAHVEQYVHEPRTTHHGKARAVPAARRLARELGVDLATVVGSGPNGRVQSVDVEEVVSRQRSAVSEWRADIVGGQERKDGKQETENKKQETGNSQLPIARAVPLTAMRHTIAERLTTSVQQAPQFQVSVDVEMARAQATVAEARTFAGEGEARVTLTAFLVKACAWALARHPGVNASFAGDAIHEWGAINVGVAVAVDAGLLVPVVHGADRLSLREIAVRLAGLGARAQAGKLRGDDLQGGTFTISNLGMFGVDRFTAILNPPQAAILAVSRAAMRPVVAENGTIEARLLADFTLTADHRVVDGAGAARFLGEIRRVVEGPGGML